MCVCVCVSTYIYFLKHNGIAFKTTCSREERAGFNRGCAAVATITAP